MGQETLDKEQSVGQSQILGAEGRGLGGGGGGMEGGQAPGLRAMGAGLGLPTLADPRGALSYSQAAFPWEGDGGWWRGARSARPPRHRGMLTGPSLAGAQPLRTGPPPAPQGPSKQLPWLQPSRLAGQTAGLARACWTRGTGAVLLPDPLSSTWEGAALSPRSHLAGHQSCPRSAAGMPCLHR